MNHKKTLTSIREFFSSQLGLFILGAVITSLLIPWFFQVWQDYQKELEIKSDLAGRISESFTRMIMSTQSFYMDGPRTTTWEQRDEMLEELNSEYNEWEITSSVIESQLRAYFPHTNLPSDWGGMMNPLASTFSNNVSRFYAMTDSIEPNGTEIGFIGERQKLLKQKDEIIQHILDSPVRSFTSNPFEQIFKGLFSQQ
jgi:hypothetical protein